VASATAVSILFGLGLVLAQPVAAAPVTQTVMLRGHSQPVLLYGRPTGKVAIVSSGDGGWLHLAPEVAQWLSDHGWFVIGVDVKRYLSNFTDRTRPLTPQDVPGDYELFSRLAGGAKPLLIGVSEGAGLSVLAASDPAVKKRFQGVIGLGLGDANELAWRWSDSIIYITKSVPREPVFYASDYISKIAPIPIALLRSTNDEFVPEEQADRLASLAAEPKRVWTIPANDHRFSNNLPGLHRCLADALDWMTAIQRTQ
jgi:fermentation-respiration switch protein FrsA (DUF1100 family)